MLICKPSKKLKLMVQLHGSTNAAANAWEIPVTTLTRFLEEGILAPVPMRIAAATGLPLDEVVTTEEGK